LGLGGIELPKKQIRREDVQATSPRQAVRRGMADQGSTARLRAAVRANPKLEEEIASLDLLDDAALWNAAQTTMPQADSERMEAFHRKQRLTGLSDTETQELARLVQQYDRVILVRTHSAALLEQRGYDVRRLISSNESRKSPAKSAV